MLIIRWNISKASTIKNQKKAFEELNEELKKEPSIQLYLYYWPKEKWESIIYPTLNNNSVIDLAK